MFTTIVRCCEHLGISMFAVANIVKCVDVSCPLMRTLGMGNSLNSAELDAEIAKILDHELGVSSLSLRGLSDASGVKLTRLGDILRRGRAITAGELESIARALGLSAWRVVKMAEEALAEVERKQAQDASEPTPPARPKLQAINGGGADTSSAHTERTLTLSEVENIHGQMA